MHPLAVAALSVGGVMMLIFCGGLGSLLYFGAAGPDTFVYQRPDIPESYLLIARQVGGLQQDETVEFLYSDGLVDIKEGFYYASDQKVGIFVAANDTPLTLIPFGTIRAVHLKRNESFLTDSSITILTNSNEISHFPVSSEMDLDVDMHQYILGRSPVAER